MSMRRRLVPVLIGGLSVTLFSAPAQASIDLALSDFAFTNQTPALVDSDAFNTNSAYTRDQIRAGGTVIYSTTNVPPNKAVMEFEWRYSICDATGGAVSVRNDAGTTSATYVVTNEIALAETATSPTAATNHVEVALTPGERLFIGNHYLIKVEVGTRADTNSAFAPTGISTSTAPMQFTHFIGTNPTDSAANVIGLVYTGAFTRAFAVDTIPGKDHFTAELGYVLFRYDGWSTGPVTNDIPVEFCYELREAGSGDPIPLVTNRSELSVSIASHRNTGTPLVGAFAIGTHEVHIDPVGQIDSVSNTYVLVATIKHLEEPPGRYATNNTETLSEETLLHFNGTLWWNDLETVFTAISNEPPVLLKSSFAIRTTLAVTGSTGYLVGSPNYSYGDGSTLVVNLRPDGDARVRAGVQKLAAPSSSDTGSVRNIKFQRVDGIDLTAAGGFVDFRVDWPRGSGHREDLGGYVLKDDILFTGAKLTQSLLPAAPLTTNDTFFVAEESKPVWFWAQGITWNATNGQLMVDATNTSYMREPHYRFLEASPVDLSFKNKLSNDNYYRALDGLTNGVPVITADANCTARLRVELSFTNGLFGTHFPYAGALRWNGNGLMSISNDAVQTAESRLEGASATQIFPYMRDCLAPDCGAGVGNGLAALYADQSNLCFTADGGLVATGTSAISIWTGWGWIDDPDITNFAHQVSPFADGTLHMPGTFLRGEDNALADDQGASTILLTGVRPLERPGTVAYLNGFGDYAGVNHRTLVDSAFTGHSVLGGRPSGAYPLSGRSKYYLRWSGVSGIHEATFGAFPPTAEIYGYDVAFSNFGLSFLSMEVEESRTEGNIAIPYPADVAQNFEELTFNCLGALEDAKVPAHELGLTKTLSYWAADFETLAVAFDRSSADTCNPGEGFLSLGVGSALPYIDDALYGTLAFSSNGNIVTSGDAELDPPYDGRLVPPTQFTIPGLTGEDYACTPVNAFYLNNYDHATPTQLIGYVNMAAGMDVPFFEDVQVHIQTSANTNLSDPVLYLMGGWPDKGFEDGPGVHFFTTSLADPDNLGKPNGISEASYRDGDVGGSEEYLVRAQKQWLGVIDLDYPMQWSDSTRIFTKHEAIVSDFLVIELEHSLDSLSAEEAHISVGATYEGLPSIDLAALAVGEINGLEDAFDAVIGSSGRNAIENGLAQLDTMLNTAMSELLDPAFEAVIDPIICDLYEALSNAFDGVSWTNDPSQVIHDYLHGTGPVAAVNSISNKIVQVMSAAPDTPGVLQDVETALCDATNGVAELEALLASDFSGTPSLLIDLIQEIVEAEIPDLLGSVADALLGPYIEELAPELDALEASLSSVRGEIAEVKDLVQSGEEIQLEIENQIGALGSELTGVIIDAEKTITNFFAEIDVVLDPPFTHYTADELKDEIRKSIEDELYGSLLASALQEILKQRLYDLDATLREAVDSTFQQVNTAMRDLMNESLADIDDSFTGFEDGAAAVMGGGRLDGYAHINGDSLSLLRVDMKAQLMVPSEMEFDAYLQIKELNSDGTPTDCLPAGGSANEVTLGADNVSIEFISPDLRASLDGKFTFDTSGPLPALANMGAGFELDGPLSFEALEISYLGASMSMGEFENYFSAAARAKVNGYEGAGGVFLGKSCSVDALFWDPDVQDVVGAPPFSGAYFYGEVWIPISEVLLGIPASCFFEVSAGVGAGAGYFSEGPTYIGKMLLGASGDVLCLVSVGGEVKLVGVHSPDGLRLKGSGKLFGEIGACPFCVSFERRLGLEYANGKWDYDF